MYRKINQGQDLLNDMSIGKVKKVEDWLNKNGATDSGYIIRQNNVEKLFIIDVEGNVVLENFDIVNAEGIQGFYQVEFGDVLGSITILSHLPTEEIYSRIKKFYEMILNNCLRQSVEEQENFLFGTNGERRYHNNVRIRAECIEESEPYIRNLPDNPNQEQMKELVDQVLDKILEYGYHAKDEYSVEMHLYAEALKRRL